MKLNLQSVKLRLAEIIKQKKPPRYYIPLLVILRTLSWLYGAAVNIRNYLYDAEIFNSSEVDIPVVSVGNIVVGGTGKTPVVRELAEMLKNSGYSPAVICKGYGQEVVEPEMVSDGENIFLGADEVGDEALLLAAELDKIPVVVCQNKTKAAEWVDKNLNSDIMLIDDGFQHRSLNRDFDLVLLDVNLPFGNGHLLPRGFLREHPKNLQRADGIIITRVEQADEQSIMQIWQEIADLNGELSVFLGNYQPRYLHDFRQNRYSLEYIAGERVKAFSSIGNPDSFITTLNNLGCHVDEHFVFPDHHDYSRSDFAGEDGFIPREAAKSEDVEKKSDEAQFLLTTSKDFTKLSEDLVDYIQRQGYKLLVLKMAMKISPGADLSRLDLDDVNFAENNLEELLRQEDFCGSENLTDTIIDFLQ